MNAEGQPGARDWRTGSILGCAIEVQKTLGCGFLEAAYQEALALEFERGSIPFQKEVPLPISYKGRTLKTVWRADFVVHGAVVVELKAISALTDTHRSQVFHYLKATGLSVGLLLNFGRPRLEFQRIVLSKSQPVSAPSASSAFKSPLDVPSGGL